jgi:hypothetical protein
MHRLASMPIGYAIPVVLLAFCTVVAVIGPRPAPSYWGFWATFLINEQPFVPIYVLVANSALAFAQGDLGLLWSLGVADRRYGRGWMLLVER